MHNRRTKIVATLGPSSSGPDMIRALYDAGADVFRLNFSHGDHAGHKANYDAIRALEAEVGQPIGILQDLQGPKIRLGPLTGDEVRVEAGETVTFDLDTAPGTGERIPLLHPEIFAASMPGHTLLIDDGKLRFRVTKASKDRIEAEAQLAGTLKSRKGVNVPDAVLDLTPITDKDREDLAFGLELGVDWVALSFVQRADDVLAGKALVGDRAGIMVKIEKPAALVHMTDIIAAADAVMVARGDLGVEIPLEEVPGRQKELILVARRAGKPVIVATQMLESMISAPAPTRAEASDVANAVFEGADAVMLSAESAAGDYPTEAVTVMDKIIKETERQAVYRASINALAPPVEHSIYHAVSKAAADLAEAIDAAAVVAYTSSGTTAARISRERPILPVLAVTPRQDVARRLTLYWGSLSIQSEDIDNFDEAIEQVANMVRKLGIAKKGERVVTVAGVPFGVKGSTNNLRVVEV